MIGYSARLAPTAPAALLLASLATSAQAQGTLRIAMTASDVPTTTGAPDNGFEGLRFLGYPAHEGLVLWDLTRADKLAEIRPGLAESWEQDQNDRSKWIFHLRPGANLVPLAADRGGDRCGLEGAATLRISAGISARGRPGSRADGGPAASAEGRRRTGCRAA